MSTLNIPVPTISTGPKHMTDTEAAEHYLREVRNRTEKLQAGSGVTALVNRLLDDVLDALEELNTGTVTPTPERATLSATYPQQCCAESCVEEIGLHDVYPDTAKRAIEFIAAREQALREEVAKVIQDRHAGDHSPLLPKLQAIVDGNWSTTAASIRAALRGETR